MSNYTVKLAQISDIHLGGEYGGKFDVEGNFRKLLDKIQEDRMLIITGDLADENHKVHYEAIKTAVEAKFRHYMVLPGNHDDVPLMYEIFHGHMGWTMYKGLGISLVPTIAVHGTGPLGEHTVEGGLLPSADLNTAILRDSLVFTHYPVISSSHKFMNKFALNYADKHAILSEMIKKRCRWLFCGHFHDYCRSDYKTYVEEHLNDTIKSSTMCEKTSITQYICPASQCQIDPHSYTFVATSTQPDGLLINAELDDNQLILDLQVRTIF